jgi:CII-binding regulator of phage lambda lysogenization HflD
MMSDKSENKINALKASAKNRSKAAKERIEKALEEMKKNNIPITFQSVAKYAKVSKTIIYADIEKSAQIKEYRNQASIMHRMLDLKKQLNKKDDVIFKLEKRIEYLSSEIQKLKLQLEVVYGELYNSKLGHGA